MAEDCDAGADGCDGRIAAGVIPGLSFQWGRVCLIGGLAVRWV